jgi:hypothetical protein
VLDRWPVRDNLLVDGPDLPVNYAFNGLALLTMLATAPGLEARADRVAEALALARGVALRPSDRLEQNNQLQAWAWVEKTFSWVEPTAWCALALKKWSRSHRATAAMQARLEDADRLLLDRVCPSGGWNYGNARVFGHALWAYVPTTALGLLALQDRADHPLVRKSLSSLERDAYTEPSALSLAMALVALGVYGQPVEGVRTALVERFPIAGTLGQVCGLAFGAYAAEQDIHGCSAFRL